MDTVRGGYSLGSWYTTAGYDLATGLGSVDANALVNNWNTISFAPTTTTMTATPLSITHGTSVTLTVQTSASSGSVVPTGSVSFTTDNPLPNSRSIIAAELDKSGAGSSTVNYLPGGTYNVYARYGGDTSFAASQSAPVAVTVTAEPVTLTTVATKTVYYPAAATALLASGSTVTYGSYLAFNVQVAGANSTKDTLDGAATGSVQVMDNGQPLAEVPLNATGAIYFSISTLPLGSHSLTFSYAGDASFQSSTSAPFTLTVGKGKARIDYVVVDIPFAGNSTYAIQVEVGSEEQINFGGGLAPTGSVTVTLGPKTLTLPLMPTTNGTGVTTAVFTDLQPGLYTTYISYTGDSNWASATEQGEVPTTVTSPSLPMSTTTLSMTSPGSNATPLAPGTLITMNATVTGNGTAAPTGDIFVMINGIYLLQHGTGPTSTATFTFPAYEGYSGTNQVSVWFFGDSNYASSVSNVISYTANVDDFTLNTNFATLSVTSGQTGNLDVLLNSYNTSTDTVHLTCTVVGGPSGNTVLPQCSVPATQALSATGQVAVKMTINTLLTLFADAAPMRSSLWTFAGAPTLAALFFFLPKRYRLRRFFGVLLLAISLIATISGCGGSKAVVAPPTPPKTQNVPAGTYTMLITASNSATTHSVPVTIIVK